MSEETLTGIIVVDKPTGWTSHDVVNRMRRLVGTRRIGHLGTLDPLATGVLPLLINRATRLAQFFGQSDKVYEGVVQFGYATSTFDADGEPTTPETVVTLDAGDLERQLEAFRGPIMQTPPPVSAKKIGGTPAYKLARKNIEVTLAPVAVEIFSIELLGCANNTASIRVHCTAGTYIRSIAHELGKNLGCGAFLKSLRRTASGGFGLDMARSLDQIQELSTNGQLREALIPAAELLPEFPAETVDAPTAGFIRQGRDFHVSPFRGARGARYVKAVTQGGELIAIGEAKLPNVYHPILVL